MNLGGLFILDNCVMFVHTVGQGGCAKSALAAC